MLHHHTEHPRDTEPITDGYRAGAPRATAAEPASHTRWLLRAALIGAAIALTLGGSLADAQVLHGGPVVQIVPPSQAAGNITLRGVAADCDSGLAPTRVAIYDGTDPSAPYLMDAAIDTAADLSVACPGRSGQARIGFTAIVDSRLLPDGSHPLMFWAEYPNGATAVGTANVTLANVLPYESLNNGSDSSSSSD